VCNIDKTFDGATLVIVQDSECAVKSYCTALCPQNTINSTSNEEKIELIYTKIRKYEILFIMYII